MAGSGSVTRPGFEQFLTDSVESAQRLSFWNAVAAATFGEISVAPCSRGFSGRLLRRRVGDLMLARVASTPARVRGGAVSPRGRGWFLLYNQQGACELGQRDQRTRLSVGEFTTLRADEPYRIAFDEPNAMTILHLAGDEARIDLDRHIARRHRPDDAPLLAALLVQLDRPATELEGAGTRLLARLVADLARLSWPARSGREARQPLAAWIRRIRQEVEAGLGDPGLDAAQLGAALGISPRFVQMAFARMGTTPSAYILEQRLELAARRLRAEPALPVTEIALDAGFGDLSHFCRTFRRRFGTSAGAYRRAGRES